VNADDDSDSDSDDEDYSSDSDDDDGNEDDDDDADMYDRVSQEELDELLADKDNDSIPSTADTEPESDSDDDADTAPTDAAVADPADPEEQSMEANSGGRTRSGRTVRQPTRLNVGSLRGQSYAQKEYKKTITFEDEVLAAKEVCHNIICPEPTDPDRRLDYTEDEAAVLAMYMTELQQKIEEKGVAFVQQYLLRDGLKKFGEKGREAALKEMDQLDKRKVFTPIAVKDLTYDEKAKAVNGIMFLAEKRDKRIKGHFVYNGKPSRAWHG
jgi:hypothetical protein